MTSCNFTEIDLDDAKVETSSEDIIRISVTSVLLFFLVFGMAGTVDFDAFKKKFASKKGILIGVGCQFFILPLVGFIFVQIFKDFFDEEPLLGQILIVTLSAPGGSFSNWWCSLINADLALSVAMTTVSTFVSVFMLPLNVYLYADLALGGGGDVQSSLDWSSIGTSLGVVIAAVITGLLVGYNYPERHHQLNLMGNICGFVLIVVGFLFSNEGGSTQLWEKDFEIYAVVFLPCMFSLALAFVMATLVGLRKEERVAVAIETCYQNTGIATAVAFAFGPAVGSTCAADVAAIPILYGMVVVVVIGLFALMSWQLNWTLAPRDENICKVLFTDHQPNSADAASEPDGHEAIATAKSPGPGQITPNENGTKSDSGNSDEPPF